MYIASTEIGYINDLCRYKSIGCDGTWPLLGLSRGKISNKDMEFVIISVVDTDAVQFAVVMLVNSSTLLQQYYNMTIALLAVLLTFC